MRRFLLLSLLMAFSVLVFAQTKEIAGRVIDDAGSPVPFASVLIKGTSTGVSADENGQFIIRAKSGDVLEVTSQGFSTNSVTIGSGNRVEIKISKSNDNLAEVIVSTGYSGKQTARSLTSNAQKISTEQLNTIRQTNINNALAGKVSGIQLRSQSAAALGRDAQIRLRGDGTLNGGSLLYIVDGTPTNAVDINMDDVEDLTVLNGPTGAAIYGPQAASGAIVVTMKKAKRGQKGIGLEINSGVMADRIYVYPNVQNSYAGGGNPDLIQFQWKSGMPEEWKALDGKFYHDYSDDASWGPRMVGQEYIPWYAWNPGTKYSFKTANLTPQPNNIRDFFNTGITATNNINFSKASENYNLRMSYTNLDIKGLIPNSFLKRHNFGINGGFDLNEHFNIGANVNYVTQNQNAQNDDGYSNQSTGSFFSWFHRDLDMKIMKEMRGMYSPDGTTGKAGVLMSWNRSGPGVYDATDPQKFYAANYWYNFYDYFDNIRNDFRRDRVFGDVNFTYKVNNDLKFRVAYRKNFVATNFENKGNYALERSANQTGFKAFYGTGETFFNDDRYELVGTYNKKFNDISLDVLAGAEAVKIQSKSINSSTRDGLYIPDYFVLSNSIGSITTGNSRSFEKRRAMFAKAGLGWKNMLFGEATLRNDWFSTLPVNDNSILVKSFGGSFIFSELTKNTLPWLSYGKLRASWGETPEAVGPYALALYYGVNPDQWNNYFTMGTPNQIVSSAIRGAVQTMREGGIDLKFLRNRLGISATYYDALTTNSPVAIDIDGSTGFTQKLVNAGKITRKGFELQGFVIPIQNDNMRWEIGATYAKLLDNTIVEIAPGVDQIVQNFGARFNGITPPYEVQKKGEKARMLIGGGKKYLNGKVVVDKDGFYVRQDNVNFGSVLPVFQGGFQNMFDYKNLIFNFNIDYQYGGKFFSLSDMWGSYSGLMARTATINDKGNPVRDAVSDGGGIHVVGVTEDGTAVDKYVPAQDYFHNMVSNNVFDEFVYDLTFVKLREVSLGYKLPVARWGATRWVQNATFSITARNPWLIYAKTRDFDPSEISRSYGEDGQLPGTRSIGFNLKIGF